jgi:hypothetical protein
MCISVAPLCFYLIQKTKIRENLFNSFLKSTPQMPHP